MIKVFLVDDHQMVIEGIVLLLQNDTEIECVGHAKDGCSAISQLSNLEVDVVLLDINLPDKNGTEVCRILLQQQVHLKIIALSMLKEASLVKMMLKEGAKGYLLKNAGQVELIKAIKTVYQGEQYLSTEVNSILLDSLAGKKNTKRKNPFPKLSRREKEVLQLIIDEKTTQDNKLARKVHQSVIKGLQDKAKIVQSKGYL